MVNKNITLTDSLSLNDKNFNLNTIKKQDSNYLRGFVRILKNGIVTVDDDHPDGWHRNMVVADGRETVAQRISGKFHQNSSLGDLREYTVKGFAIGNGGAVDTQITWTPIGPDLGDKGLYSPVPINSNCVAATDNSGTSHEHIVKLIESQGPGGTPGSIELLENNNQEFSELTTPYYTVVKYTCVVDLQEPTYTEEVKISEAGLYLLSPTNTNPVLFAHLPFAPRWIDHTSGLTIEWHILS